jgi:uncharacterized protein DUF4389
MEKQELKQNMSNCSQWTRLLYMLLFGVILYFVMAVLCVVVVVQAVFSLVTGSANENIQEFSKDLSRYITQIVLFLTYNENEMPYPFKPLGNEGGGDAQKKDEHEKEKDQHETIIDVEACDDNADDGDKPAA